MSRHDSDVVTMVNGIGEVVVDFDYAVFVAVVKSLCEEDSRTAKNAVIESIDRLKEVVDRLNEDGLVEQVITFFDVGLQRVHKNGKYEREGYVAEYTFRFTTKRLDEVSDIHDALTEVGENVSVDSPLFRLSNQDKHEYEAVTRAWEHARKRFSNQCSVLGFDVDEFEVCKWIVTHNGAKLSKGDFGGGAGESVEIFGGMARIKVNLCVSYRKK